MVVRKCALDCALHWLLLLFYFSASSKLVLVRGCTQEGTTAPALVQVNTSRGAVLGYHVDFGTDSTRLFYGQADVFEGIPYVQAPTGPLRFKRPVRLVQFAQSPIIATSQQPACPQSNRRWPQSEDCLFLNIYTPNATVTSKLPVMLWIHGGAFLSGSTQSYDMKGIVRNFVSRGVVVVTIQYRLGLLGFFTTFTDDFPPNRGMLDQVEAIWWVKEEIGNFGGNPDKLTLFGESAGAASVAAHLLSPMSNTLFQHAIIESGATYTCFDGVVGFQNISNYLAEQLCDFTTADWNTLNFSSLVECLQDMNTSTWLPYDAELLFGWQIVTDGYFIPEVPSVLQARRPNIPVIYGNCHDEWANFEVFYAFPNSTNFTTYSKKMFEVLFNRFASYLTSQNSAVLSTIEESYTPPGTADDDYMAWLKIGSDVFTGMLFTGFMRREIDWYLQAANKNVFAFEMTYVSDVGRFVQIDDWKPVGHTCELPFLFMKEKDWTHAAETGQLRPEDRELADWFADAWTTFAKFGRPSLVADAWPPLRKQELQYLRVGAQRSVQKFYRRRDAWLWNNVLPSLIGFWPPERVDHNNGTSAWHAWNPSKNSYV